MKSDLIDLEGKLRRETDGAYLVDFGGDEPVWLPKSFVEWDGDKEFAMPEWLAMEKELI